MGRQAAGREPGGGRTGDNGFTDRQSRKTTLAAVEAYRTAMRSFAAQPILDVWYTHLNLEQAIAEYRALSQPGS